MRFNIGISCTLMGLFVILMRFTPVVSAQANPTVLWEKTLGGSPEDIGYSVQHTSDGGYIITGQTYSSSSVRDIYLIKTDVDGNIIWEKTFGGPWNDLGNAVKETANKEYIIVGTKVNNGSDVCLIKTNSNGDIVWEKLFGLWEQGISNHDYGYSFDQTSDGGYIIAGRTYYNRAQDSDIYIIKTDSDGNLEWEKTFDGISYDNAYAVKQSSDGEYIVAGMTYVSHSGVSWGDVYLFKIDSEGEILWEKTFGGPDYEDCSSMQTTADGGYILVGGRYYANTEKYDVYLIKTNSDGNLIWEKTFGGSDDDYGFSVQQTLDGGYVVTGRTSSLGAGMKDVYIIRTDPEGNLLWEKTLGGLYDDFGRSIIQTADGEYIVTGKYTFPFNMSYVYLAKLTEQTNGKIKLTNILVRQQNESIFNSYPLRTALGVKKSDEVRFEGVVVDKQDNPLPNQQIKVYDPLQYDPDNSSDGKILITSGADGKFYYPSASGSISLVNAPAGVLSYWFNIINTNAAVPFCLVVNDISITVDEINNAFKDLIAGEPSIISIHVDTSKASPFRDLFIPAEAYPQNDDNLDAETNDTFFLFFSVVYVGPTDEDFLLTSSYNAGWLRRGFDLYHSKVRNVLENLPERFESVLPPVSSNTLHKMTNVSGIADYDILETSNMWWYVGEGLVCLSFWVPTGITQVIGSVGCYALATHVATDLIKTGVTSDIVQKPFGADGNKELDAGLELTVDIGSIVYSFKNMPTHVAHLNNPRNFKHGPMGRVNAIAELISYFKDVGKTGVEVWDYSQMTGYNYQNSYGYYKGSEFNNLAFTYPTYGTKTHLSWDFTRANKPNLRFKPPAYFDDDTNPSKLIINVVSTRPFYEVGTTTQTVPTLNISGYYFPMEDIFDVNSQLFKARAEISVNELPNWDPSDPDSWSEHISAGGTNFESIWGSCEGSFCSSAGQTLYLRSNENNSLRKLIQNSTIIASLDILPNAFGDKSVFVSLSSNSPSQFSYENQDYLITLSSVIEVDIDESSFSIPANLKIYFLSMDVADKYELSICRFDDTTENWEQVQTEISIMDSTASTNITLPGKYALMQVNKIVNVEDHRLTEIPKEFNLLQNFPNPFNPVTRIEFSVPRMSPVKMDVYNALGQYITTLVDENMNSGHYSINFDGSGLVSGLYFYRFQAGNITQIKKMILLR